MNQRKYPTFITLLFATFCCVSFFATAAAAQTFTVNGTQRGWLDTRLDIPPNTMVRIYATGLVDVGSGWGVHGPEGTTRFANVAGYPAATRYRYGLVARMTQSRTTALDEEARTDYAYAEGREFCSGPGGHLWLAMNDDRPENNGGNFTVTVTVGGKCAGTAVGAPAPLRGTFAVRFNGFSVHRQTWDDALNSDGWGDEVYLVYNADAIDVTGADSRVSATAGSRTSTYGDTGAGANIVRAGNATENGGLVTGNAFPTATPWVGATRPSPVILFQGELVQGRVGGVFFPAIFETDRRSSMADAYNRAVSMARPATRAALADLIRGPALRAPAQFLRGGETLGLAGLTSAVLHGDSFTGESADRPIGMRPPPSRGVVITGGGALSGSATYSFIPQGLVLTYESADVISRSDLFGKGRGVVEVRYRDDDRLRGDYSLYFQVDRVY